MLGMFQEAAISYIDENTSVLMPFNIFYKSLPRYIDHIHSSVIIKAKKNQKLEDFDVELLKVLFMIKYVTGIKANPQNLTTLMVGHIDEDVMNLRNKIDKSLKRLVDQTLVQKNGEIYSFLTHEEQDINRAIQQENVELGEIINKASSVIFEDIFQDSKYSYSPRYNFSFNKAVDDRYLGKHSADMGVRVITPYYDFRLSTDDHSNMISPISEGEQINTILRGISEENNEVIIHLGEDSSFLDEITGLLKIEKYLIKKSVDLSPSSESILKAKRDEASEKRGRIKLYLKEALKHAEIYVKGDKVNIQKKILLKESRTP
ncbi:hypothetical protein [Methanobacterium ferruginis]|uniref:hypothetical protein n=1 Tax=Methanobacterium ferruginis TaxID=710191 RepID=UPI00257442A9|nr:hypothetical protein [Methanobacterium ferruginis]BDZ68763.1 hypothetical protein GCM10025860_22110 [Methanobacterium ferruginis]